MPVADGGFVLTDTGGMFGDSDDPSTSWWSRPAAGRSTTADLIVFVVDGRQGLVPGDEEIAKVVRGTGRQVLLAINKTDDKRAAAGALDLYRLGFDPVIEMSAEHGRGVGDLMDEIVRRLPARAAADGAVPDEEEERHGEHAPGGARRGHRRPPNAGKSSLVNRLLREDRMIVSDTPGTTRDPVDSASIWHRKKVRIVDTAGIRKAGRVARGGAVESLSVLLARRSIAQADVVVVVIDALAGATDQDAAIAGEGGGGGPRHRHGGEQVGSDRGSRRGRGRRHRRRDPPPPAVPRLRADPPHLGPDRRQDAAAAGDSSTGSPWRGGAASRRRS